MTNLKFKLLCEREVDMVQQRKNKKKNTMKLKFNLMIAASALFLASCGGEEKPTTEAPEVVAEVEETFVRPAEEVIASGNSVEMIHTSPINDYTFLYTVLDYTKNCEFAALPIDEYTGPTDEEQLVKVRVDVKAISFRKLNCKEPLDAFHLLFGTSDVQAFTRFSEEFKANMATKCLAVDESQTLDVYFKIPLDADLSAAQLSVYRGSSEEASVVNLNK